MMLPLPEYDENKHSHADGLYITYDEHISVTTIGQNLFAIYRADNLLP